MATDEQLRLVLSRLLGSITTDSPSVWYRIDRWRIGEVLDHLDEFTDNFLALAANGGKLVIGKPDKIHINRSTGRFLALLKTGVTEWRGPANGDGRQSALRRDKRSVMLNTLHPDRLVCFHEKPTSADAKYFIWPDVFVVEELLSEPGFRTLEWMREAWKLKQFYFGEIVLRVGGRRCSLFVEWDGIVWKPGYSVLRERERRQYPTFVIAPS